MIRSEIDPRLRAGLGVAAMALLLLGYTWLSYTQHLENPNDTTIPSWAQLYAGVTEMVTPAKRSGEIILYVDLKATFYRLFLGLGTAVVSGVLLGLYMGAFSWLEAFFGPILTAVSKVVPTAAMAVFFVLVGTHIEMYVSMIVFGVMPPLALSVYLAARDVPDELVNKAYTVGASHSEVIWNVVFPTILPKVLDLIRLSIGPALVYLIAAEMLVGDEGIGYRIRLRQKLLHMQIVYPYLVILAGFGFGADFGLRRLRSWWCPWAEEAGR